MNVAPNVEKNMKSTTIDLPTNKSNKKSKTMIKVSDVPSEPSQFVITYVTSTSAIFDTMKNSKVSTGKNISKQNENNVDGDGDGSGEREGDEEDNRRPKEEKTLICDKVIFATGGSR